MIAADADVVSMEVDGVEKLSSNVMNYLVWRYLQESGYGKTAKQLQYQWIGRDDSPEELPFAKKVRKSCLVHMVQDGLLLDHLQAEVKKINRQYVFGTDHGRKFSVPAEEIREKKTRRSTSHIPNSNDTTMQNGSPAEPPARKAKGKRKSGGTDKRVNGTGEAMDLDPAATTNAAVAPEVEATNTSHIEHIEQISQAESPAEVIEELPPISTLEIGESKGTITEKPRDLVPGTAFLDLAPNTALEQVTWSPHNKNALATAGKNHARFFKVSNNSDIPENTRHNDLFIPSIPDDYEVQAFCWTEKGSGAFTTLERIKNEEGDEMMQYKMHGFVDYGAKVALVDPTAGWVLGLKHNSESELLISLSWGEQSHVKIWAYDETIIENSKRRVEPRFELKWAKTMGSMLYAVDWVALNRFLVCGKNTLAMYEVGDDEIRLVKEVDTDVEWVTLKFDVMDEIAVVHDLECQTIGIVTISGDELQLHTQRLEYRITDLAFQPMDLRTTNGHGAGHAASRRCLAIASDLGQIHLYTILPASGAQHIQTLEMGFDATAQVLSFTRDGFALAAAGYDTLNVWTTSEEGRARHVAVWRVPHGSDERWRSEVAEEEGDGDDGVAEDDNFKHLLGWDSDGKRLAFGMNGQVAVIRV